MNTFNKIITALTISTLCVTFSSHAIPIVNNWDFVVDTAFTDFNHATDVTGSNNNAFFSNAPTTLSWGIPLGTNKSSLDVSSGSNGTVTGSVLTDGAAETTASLIHNNFVIDFPGNNPTRALTDAKLSTILRLAPSGNPVQAIAPPLVFDITFKETSNSGQCSDVSSINGCNDIFVIDLESSGATFDPNSSSFNQEFSFMGYSYIVSLGVLGLGALDDPVCLDAGVGTGCIGLTTIEDAVNQFDVAMSITSNGPEIRRVPEPSAILLMSLALLCILVSNRK
jgi:hypothetical protein